VSFGSHTLHFESAGDQIYHLRFSTQVCCSVWQCVVVRCNALQCVAVCCSVFEQGLRCALQCDVVYCNLSSVFFNAGVLQCVASVAVCCSVLKCAVVCHSVMQSVEECCSVLQCVAVSCSVLK